MTTLPEQPEPYTLPEHFKTKKMERTTGIEPAPSAWEADILPMNYVRTLYYITP